jgi:hypothetical protein
MQVERAFCRKVRSEWRTGEEHVGDLPFSEEYRREIADKTAYGSLFAKGTKVSSQGEMLEDGPAAD